MDIKEAIGSSIGKGLLESEIELVARLATVREFTGGETIVRQFDRHTDLIFVLEGKVRVVTMKDEPLAELGPGSVLGEVSLVDEGPRSATARSAGTTKVAIIPAEKIRELWMDNDHIGAVLALNIAKVLASRLRLASINLDGLMPGR